MPGRIFSNVFLSQPSPGPLTAKRHSREARERIDGEIKKKWKDRKEDAGEEEDEKEERKVGGEEEGCPPSPPFFATGNHPGANPSKQGPMRLETQIQQNVRCSHETSKWSNLTSEGLQMLEELREQKVPAGC